MALSAKVVSFNLSSALITATTVVSGIGFAPKALILWSQASTTGVDTVVDGSVSIGMGFATSVSNRNAIAYYSDDNNASAFSKGVTRDAACLCFLKNLVGVATDDGIVDLSSFDSDGFTLINDSAIGGTYRIHCLVLGGDDLTNVFVGNFIATTIDATTDITGVGFKPDCVIMCAGKGNTVNTISNDGQLMVGFAAGSTPVNKVVATQSDDLSAIADCDRYGFSGECYAYIPAAGGASVSGRHHVSSWLSDGFRLTTDELGNITRAIYLVLKGGSYFAGDFLTQTDTTTNITESGFGFAPKAAFVISHCTAKSTVDTTQTQSAASIGAFSGTSERAAIGFLDEDAADPTQTEFIIEHDAFYARVNNSAGIDGLCDVTSLDSDGFTGIMDDADSSQAFVSYLAFGNAAAVTTSLKDVIGYGVIPFPR